MLSFVLVFPQKTNAQYVDVSNAFKEYVGDPLAYFAANIALKKISAQTVNWINSGFKGNPGYLTDPTQFFLDIGDNVASDFLSGPKMNMLCSPFNAQVRLALVKNYISQDEGNYSCTLSTLKNNYDQFIGDFSQGGWDGWFELTQNQSNNPYGAYLQAQISLSKELGIENNKYLKQLEQGKGFLSFQKCKASSVLSQSDINSLGAAGAKYKVGDCWNNDYEVVTPGTVIENQINGVLGSGENRIIAADEIDEIVGALLNQLIGRVIGGGTGLLGASQSSQTSPSLSQQLATEPTQQPSNPNANQVSGGTPNCTTTSGSPGVYDVDGNLIEAPESGSTNCTVTPVQYNTPGGGASSGGNDCVMPPTTAQTQETQNAIDFMIPQLEAIQKMNPITTPAPQWYQQAVQDIINRTNAIYPSVAALYYPGENVIGMAFNYLVGPATIVVSNQVGIGDTWRNAWRVTCSTTTGGGGGGGGRCSDPGGTVANYTSAVINAEGAVLNNNPALASSLNTVSNSESFVSLVASELRNAGYESSSTVLSGNDVVHTENYVAVWRSGDTAIERYEAVNHAGDGDMTIRNAAQAQYSGDILISCAL
ncbi:MAG: hypothetical protein AB201_00105 [Parcubacteria bacterium C7867-006]|nr:MAG: hypothetical protein AB201_00105 [Parcubacteria bacterium C7867-006]